MMRRLSIHRKKRPQSQASVIDTTESKTTKTGARKNEKKKP
jgi:hypothetical protein